MMWNDDNVKRGNICNVMLKIMLIKIFFLLHVYVVIFYVHLLLINVLKNHDDVCAQSRMVDRYVLYVRSRSYQHL